MEAYKTEATLSRDGTLVLEGLPFHAGERVEVIVLAGPAAPLAGARYPLRGTAYRYERPTDPVADEDWESLR